ncbi:hypothetical protein ACQKNC_14450 [Lysinibacillus sp. NPDC094177]|uniref:hypothetical protein n=1 Tax=Lysinibacillus sp. NPDC094177 TaxID=3390580 RepID=UPI003D01BB7A
MSRLDLHDVGHEGVITGRDGFSLRSSIADPQGVAQPPLQSTYMVYVLTNAIRKLLGSLVKFYPALTGSNLSVSKEKRQVPPL